MVEFQIGLWSVRQTPNCYKYVMDAAGQVNNRARQMAAGLSDGKGNVEDKTLPLDLLLEVALNQITNFSYCRTNKRSDVCR